MRIRLIAVGERQPAWVNAGFENYARRMPRECALELIEIRAAARHRSSQPDKARSDEASRMLKAVPDAALVIALDEKGKQFSSRELAGMLADWQQDGRDVALLVGGADGLGAACLERAGQRWSLSRMTLPHGLVRVVVAEQLYRAWSISTGHPYHRD